MSWMDAEDTYTHRKAVDVLLPYDEALEAHSSWSSQVQLLRKASLFHRHMLSLSLIAAANPLHRAYTRGSAGHPCSWGAAYALQEHWPPPSLQSLIRWTCSPCAAEAGESLDLAAFGSLQWVGQAGRAGSWPMSFAEAVDPAVCAQHADCACSGLLGSAPALTGRLADSSSNSTGSSLSQSSAAGCAAELRLLQVRGGG